MSVAWGGAAGRPIGLECRGAEAGAPYCFRGLATADGRGYWIRGWASAPIIGLIQWVNQHLADSRSDSTAASTSKSRFDRLSPR